MPDEQAAPTTSVSPQREANVAYANSLMETEIAQRNARKDSQEGTARWIVASTGLLVTLLLGLAKDEGVFSSSASVVGRTALVATVALGGLAVFCAIRCLWPRKYERLGATGLVNFNRTEFLDKPEHEVMGTVVASRIAIATKMDELHEEKAGWLKWSFRFLLAAFVGLVVQGAVLAIAPPTSPSTASSTVDSGSKAARLPLGHEPKGTKRSRCPQRSRSTLTTSTHFTRWVARRRTTPCRLSRTNSACRTRSSSPTTNPHRHPNPSRNPRTNHCPRK